MLMILFFQRQTKLGERIFMKRARTMKSTSCFSRSLRTSCSALARSWKGTWWKRQLAPAREGSQVGPVADDDDGLRSQRGRRFREQAFEDMGLLRDENGQPLRTHRREMNLRFHLQVEGGLADAALNNRLVEAGGRPRGLEGHAELAAGDLFLHGLDIGAQLEEQLRDPGDDAGLVVADQGDGR